MKLIAPPRAEALSAACILAKSARRAYEEAIELERDGAVSPAAWIVISDDLHYASAQMRVAGALAGIVETLRSRGFDANARAQYQTRMIEVARRGHVIDMGSLVEA